MEYNAGLVLSGINLYMVEVMRDVELELSANQSKGIEEYRDDRVITPFLLLRSADQQARSGYDILRLRNPSIIILIYSIY